MSAPKNTSTYWDISKLKSWDKNPRSIKADRFEELKTRLRRQGQIKPLLVTEDGVVIGGNQRLRAMKALGITDVWVSVCTARTDKEILDLALTDNEAMGEWDRDALAEIAMEVGFTDVELASYELNLPPPQPLTDLLDKYRPVDDEPAPDGSGKIKTCPHCGGEL